MWYGLDMYDCDMLVNKTYRITSWLYNLVEVTATFLCVHTSQQTLAETEAETMLNARTVKDWLLKEPLLMHPNISLLDACQVLTFIKLRMGNVLGCAPAWCAKSRGAEEWGGTWHPSRKKQVEGCKVRIHGSSQTCFFAYHWHYKTIIYYPSLRPSASSGKRKICPSESPHVFYSPGYCKACDSLLDRLGILALKTQHADGCPCNIMQMCNMVSMYSPDLRIRRRLSGLTQPMSLAFGTGLVPWRWSKKKSSASFLYPSCRGDVCLTFLWRPTTCFTPFLGT